MPWRLSRRHRFRCFLFNSKCPKTLDLTERTCLSKCQGFFWKQDVKKVSHPIFTYSDKYGPSLRITQRSYYSLVRKPNHEQCGAPWACLLKTQMYVEPGSSFPSKSLSRHQLPNSPRGHWCHPKRVSPHWGLHFLKQKQQNGSQTRLAGSELYFINARRQKS